MNRRYLVVGIALVAVLLFFTAYTFTGSKQEVEAVSEKEAVSESLLVRFNSPVVGPVNAPVTIVEFFDPACEACRAFYPVVKEILDAHPDRVRLVLRYAAFHDGSDTAVKILESARKQDVFIPVLEALLRAQPKWADHSGARLEYAWEAAVAAGLDFDEAQKQILDPAVLAVLNQDSADVEKIGVRRTPTFFVNGQPLLDFGAKQLIDLVQSHVNESQ